MTDPVRRGEASWLLAHAQVSAGLGTMTRLSSTRQALAAAGLPRVWEARLLALLAMLEREPSGIGTSRLHRQRALAAAEGIGDPFATAQAGYDLWLANSIERDHVSRAGLHRPGAAGDGR